MLRHGKKYRRQGGFKGWKYIFGRWLAPALGMTYRVTFMERTGVTGEPSEAPADYVAIEVPDGVVLEKLFIDRTAPDALHSEEALEEDDSFLSVGSETWDYEIAEGRDEEFVAALQNSQMVMEYVRLDEEPSAA